MLNFKEINNLRAKISAAAIVLAIAILACDSQAVTPTMVAIQPATTPTPFQPTDLIIPSPTPTQEVAVQMPTQIDNTFPFQVLTTFPQMWMTGEDQSQINERMSETIKADILARPDHTVPEVPQNYLKAVVNIEFNTDPSLPVGGTATFIGINPVTNKSIFLTSAHVMSTGLEQFWIRQPLSGLNILTSISDVTIVSSPDGDFADIAIVELPFIPPGITAFPVTGSNLCTTEDPPENMLTKAFAFPYINGGPRYVPYLMHGNVETLTDSSVGTARCWVGDIEGIPTGLYLPTTMPNRPGASGALVLNENQQGIGLVTGTSPHGALVKPLNPAVLQDLIVRSGFVFSP